MHKRLFSHIIKEYVKGVIIFTKRILRYRLLIYRVKNQIHLNTIWTTGFETKSSGTFLLYISLQFFSPST